MKELGALFVEGERPASSRYRRGQKPATSAPLSSDMPSLSPAEEPIEILESAPVIEAFDLADPVAFIDKLPKSFYTDLVPSFLFPPQKLTLLFHFSLPKNGKKEKRPVKHY